MVAEMKKKIDHCIFNSVRIETSLVVYSQNLVGFFFFFFSLIAYD